MFYELKLTMILLPYISYSLNFGIKVENMFTVSYQGLHMIFILNTG